MTLYNHSRKGSSSSLFLMMSVALIVAILGSVFMMNVQGQFVSCPYFTEVYVSPSTKVLNDTLFPPMVRGLVNSINNYNNKVNQTVRVDAECAVVPLSTNPEDENTPKINIFVKRVRFNPQQDAKKAVWILSGLSDPSIVEVTMQLVSKLLGQDFDLYTLDIRGNGRSSRIGCASAQAESPGSNDGIFISDSEWKECYQAFDTEYGTNKEFYSTKAAAIDVAKLIQQFNSKQETFVYGIGFGTLLVSRLMRYVELKSLNIVKGVVLDGVISTSGSLSYGGLLTVTDSDSIMNNVGLQFMNTFNGTQMWSDKYGKTDAVTFLKKTIQSVYLNGTCKAISNVLPLPEFKAMLGHLLLGAETRVFVPAILYRMNRCDEDLDVATILHVRDIIAARMKQYTQLTSLPMTSPVAFLNIIFAELFDPSATILDLQTQYNETQIATPEAIRFASLYQTTGWKPYSLDAQYYNQTFTTTVPVLLINGELDAETPLWSAQNQNNGIKGPHNLVTIPYTGHFTAFDSTYVNGTIPCGLQIMLNFVNMATPDAATVDTTCVKNVFLNFSGNSIVNEMIMGVNDIYEDAYEAPEIEKVVNLYLFIGVEAGTVVLSIIIICCLIYYIVQLKGKEQEKYEDLDQ
ncbi:hypothetical protein FDP41_007526 [Naegleria fowleri]|uniref:Peptidase S33 tripeptidyl aminopeptidase-like C-terminal domain-containing protein n=1 Tax=Naegleria fowleri TaxID=5763 RepID=A0A6A5CGC6_NAEFO|nr:uncharacterized protein FDP41_007526 [Naegleria fowleri]KAF0984349.1 hypothetical protein FDP41_007526 [Naegleria fowleri]